MDWVEEFYGAQNNWFGVYLGDVDESHQERAQLVEDMSREGHKSILELGAGGGQTAIAMAQIGNNVTMVELLEDSASHALKLVEQLDVKNMEVVHGDFYKVDFDKRFDVICYFDSFGIGTDEDQQRLLKRIEKWLKPDGCVIIEVGATWYWSGVAKGKEMDLGDCIRRYEFDAIGCRLIDKWWLKEKPDYVVNQSLRCYTPADFQMLLKGTGLKFDRLQPGGKVDYDLMEFDKVAPLDEAMTYYARVIKL
ncbi:MAG: class I SAM-dependent methyltransferase [Aureispira sp.]|nr:class I SAM-dependent methyltransferase [Aureispira sp.]